MKKLLIDIETAPHKAFIWGPKNAYISPKNIAEPGFTLCFAAKWVGQKPVTFKSVQDHGAEEMTETAWQMLHEADAVIHYNGTKFDIPTLNADFLEHGLTPPSNYHEIDLLRTVRQRFRRYSNRLDEIARWLDIGAKVQHKGLPLWVDCMGGCEKAWKIMKRYNKQDVYLLEDVYERLLPWIKTHPNHALYVDSDRPTCPRCGSQHIHKRGLEHTRTQSYQKFVCKDCHSWSRERMTAIEPRRRHTILTAV